MVTAKAADAPVPPHPQGLVERTAELIAIPSQSRAESAIADFVDQALVSRPGLDVVRIGDNLVARTQGGRERRIVLAGHLDTVPPAGNQQPRIEGDRLYGLGAADMKGGLAVLLWLAQVVTNPAVDVTWIFYVAEEIAQEHNGLGHLQRECPELLQGDAAILAEPTGAVVEAGCQGTLRLGVNLVGRRAHTARPWAGTNAVHRLAPLLTAVAGWQGRQPMLDGCRFREALQAVGVTGGVAGNVVPDAATLVLNHRFAPDRDPDSAVAAIRSLLTPFLGTDDTVELLDVAPGALPHLSQPLLAHLLRLSGSPPRAKLGWTDVSRFASLGIPAANFGPGDPLLAHTPDEWVDREELDTVATVLARLLTGA